MESKNKTDNKKLSNAVLQTSSPASLMLTELPEERCISCLFQMSKNSLANKLLGATASVYEEEDRNISGIYAFRNGLTLAEMQLLLLLAFYFSEHEAYHLVLYNLFHLHHYTSEV